MPVVIRKRKKNVVGERSDTNRHKMSGTVIGETTMTGMIDMIDTRIIMGNVMSDTTGITPPVTTHEGRTTTSMKTGLDRVTGTKNISIKNAQNVSDEFLFQP